MTSRTRTTAGPAPTKNVPLGDLVPNIQTDPQGRPKVPDPMPAPSAERVGALLPSHREAAEELQRLRDAARVARAELDRLSSAEAEQEDARKSNFSDSTALETRPARLRAARLAAAQAGARHAAGLSRWRWLMEDVELGAALRARAAERRGDIADALAVLADLRPVIELVDELHTVRRWLAPQAEAVRAITDEPSPDDGGELLEALDHLQAVLAEAIADAPAGPPAAPAA